MWPKSTKQLFKSYFIPDGNAKYLKNKKILVNWLKTQTPIIKDRTVFFITGDKDIMN